MKLTDRQRLSILGVLLAATLALSALSSTDQDSGGIVQPAVRPAAEPGDNGSAAQSASARSPRLKLSALERDANEVAAVDIFAPKSWYVPPPPPPPAVAAPPPAPVAPPLPFRYIGQLADINGKPVIYLVKSETVLVVSVGEIIEQDYRLDSVNETQLAFTYLPMKTQQLLPLPRR